MELGVLRKRFSRGVWLLDFEYATPAGEHVEPICLAAQELFTRKTVQVFFDPTKKVPKDPLPVGKDALLVSYAASAEWSCFLQLGWKLPENVFDSFAEFANEVSGRAGPRKLKEYPHDFETALAYHHLEHDWRGPKTKLEMQLRCAEGFPFSAAERSEIQRYCLSDVTSLAKLVSAQLARLEAAKDPKQFLQSLWRGRSTKAWAHIERVGHPLDVPTYARLLRHRETLKRDLVAEYRAQHGDPPFHENRKGRINFKFLKFGELLARACVTDWATTKTGRLKTRKDYLEEMRERYPAVRPAIDLFFQIGDLRMFGLTVGRDQRARFPLMPFKSMTGRNYPKGRQFLFAQHAWTRSLIKPQKGFALAHIDWSAAEFAIAGALSGDPVMREMYASGDPYLQFAKLTGMAPSTATKATHGMIRDVLKVWLLSAQYGASETSLVRALPYELASQLCEPLLIARKFLREHERLFDHYWAWTRARWEVFEQELVEQTVFGWKHHWNFRQKFSRTHKQFLNFPMQAGCAEVLRAACIYATEDGIEVQATIHDALLVGGREREIKKTAKRTQEHMARASKLVLDLEMRSDPKIICWPERMRDPRGVETWRDMERRLIALEPESGGGWELDFVKEQMRVEEAAKRERTLRRREKVRMVKLEMQK